jgi:catechol 2,3-dioxygenase-like lactoylglutathione lyase family enzyme
MDPVPARGVRLGHINLEVTNLGRARGFYDRFLPSLGFRRLPILDRAWLGYRKGRMTIWITVSRPRRTVRRAANVPTTGTNDPISDHLGFWVPTKELLRSLEKQLRSVPLTPVYATCRVPTRGNTWYVSNAWQDPDGNVLELYTVTRT